MRKELFLFLLIGIVFLSGCLLQANISTIPARERPAITETEIVGRLGLTEMVVRPAVDTKIRGVVIVTATKVTEGTQRVYFTIVGPGVEDVGPNINIDTDGSNGWSGILDTTEYENGVYTIGVLTFNTVEITEEEPIGGATVQVIILNG